VLVHEAVAEAAGLGPTMAPAARNVPEEGLPCAMTTRRTPQTRLIPIAGP